MDQPVDRHRHLPVIATMALLGADDLARARKLLGDTAAHAGLSSDRVHRFTVALSEIATNAILHGSGRATMTITSSDTALTVEVRDHGTGLRTDPRPTLPHPTQISGRGLWLAEHLCDHIDIHTSASGTTIRITMQL
jgi:anti-sigma regulatory factor (Ser/Thr protein kinase)